MEKNQKSEFLLPPVFLALFFIAYILIWSKLYLDIAINADIGWLLTCLERVLQGGTYTHDFYETNPPLSILIYLPAYPLYKLLGIDPSVAILTTFSLYITLTAFVIWQYFRQLNVPLATSVGLFSAFLFAQTWILSGSFGQKDHLIFLFLIPYTLMQATKIAGKPQEKWLECLSAFMGAFAICIKPHYAVVALTFIIFRFYSERSVVKLLKSPDIIISVATGLIYAVFLRLVFPDYLDVILPETLKYYIIDNPYPVTMRLRLVLFAAGAIFLSLFLYETEQTKYVKVALYSLIGMSFLCVIPYLTQNKGWIYQTFPFFGFSVMSFMVALFAVLYQSSRKLDLSVIIPYAVMLLITHNYMTGAPPGLLSKEEYTNLPYNRKILDLAWNKVFMDLEMKPFNSSLTHYADIHQGSRFAQVWPLRGISILFDRAQTKAEKEAIKAEANRYIDYIAEDINLHKPSVISIPRYAVDGAGTQEPQKNYYNLLMSNSNFAQAMSKYTFVESFSYDESLFERGAPNLKQRMRITDLFVLNKVHTQEEEHDEKENRQ